jgi:hypothetical protein
MNAVFRNGRLWTTHHAGLSFDGDQDTENTDRVAIFGYELDPDSGSGKWPLSEMLIFPQYIHQQVNGRFELGHGDMLLV